MRSLPPTIAIFLLGSWTTQAAEVGRPDRTEERSAATEEGGDAAGRPDQAGDEEEEEERAGLLDRIFEPIDPANFHRALDRGLGLDFGVRSERPEAPEIGEPVFFDVTRPLGDLKYGNELNYLYNSSTRRAPALQVIELEYNFADWRAAEFDLSYFDGNLQILTPFYQRTLGVGRRGNWVHGYQLSPDIYVRSGFVGGSAVYIFGWKPEAESRFSTLIFLGANRALINGFNPTPSGTAVPRLDPRHAGGGDERVFGAWRPVLNIDFFYDLGKKLTVGIENDLFFQAGRASEYLSFPFVTYKPGKHVFIQAGGGYYHFESQDQFTFLLHVNLVNPSTRRPRARRVEGD